jgi:hypothetical protein
MDVQPSIFQAFDRAKQDFQEISGVNEVSQGVVPSGTSGIAIENLQEAAQTRIRLKSRNVEAWLTQVGQQFVSRIMQFYSVPRIVRITEDPESIRYFKFVIDEVEDEAGETQRVATVQDFGQDEAGNAVPMEPIQYELKGNLDVRISVGTTLPFRKAQRKQQAKELFSMGIYDASDLLEDLEHPRKEQVLEKYNQRQQAAAEAEAAAAEAELAAKTGQPAPSAAAPLGAVQ